MMSLIPTAMPAQGTTVDRHGTGVDMAEGADPVFPGLDQVEAVREGGLRSDLARIDAAQNVEKREHDAFHGK